jgi:hypothetical protein
MSRVFSGSLPRESMTLAAYARPWRAGQRSRAAHARERNEPRVRLRESLRRPGRQSQRRVGRTNESACSCPTLRPYPQGGAFLEPAPGRKAGLQPGRKPGGAPLRLPSPEIAMHAATAHTGRLLYKEWRRPTGPSSHCHARRAWHCRGSEARPAPREPRRRCAVVADARVGSAAQPPLSSARRK